MHSYDDNDTNDSHGKKTKNKIKADDVKSNGAQSSWKRSHGLL